MTLLRLLPLVLLAAPLPALGQKAKAPAKSKAPAIDPQLKAEFDARDLNKDGVLTRQEVATGIQRMGVSRTKMPAERANMLAAVWFARADANKDGKVTPFEMQKLFRAVASRYDANGDGVVSLEERAAAHAEISGAKAPQGR